MICSCKAGTLIKLVGVDPVVVAGLTFHPYLGFFALSGLLRLSALLVGRKAL